jgi:xanthine dehydrogenase accessory factor
VSQVNLLADLLMRQVGVLVSVAEVQGSVPRECGAWMAVFADQVLGTIGGGHLEFQAIDMARQRLNEPGGDELQRFALGPSLGQCCGGVVHLRFEHVCADDIGEMRLRLQIHRQPVALFGGGHVGQALVQVLSHLPFDVHLGRQPRRDLSRRSCRPTCVCEHSDPVQAAVAIFRRQSRVLIMSFSHAEDLDVVASLPARQRQRGDLPYHRPDWQQDQMGNFRHRLEARGFAKSWRR